jgi:hypothetical protein
VSTVDELTTAWIIASLGPDIFSSTWCILCQYHLVIESIQNSDNSHFCLLCSQAGNPYSEQFHLYSGWIMIMQSTNLLEKHATNYKCVWKFEISEDLSLKKWAIRLLISWWRADLDKLTFRSFLTLYWIQSFSTVFKTVRCLFPLWANVKQTHFSLLSSTYRFSWSLSFRYSHWKHSNTSLPCMPYVQPISPFLILSFP